MMTNIVHSIKYSPMLHYDPIQSLTQLQFHDNSIVIVENDQYFLLGPNLSDCSQITKTDSFIFHLIQSKKTGLIESDPLLKLAMHKLIKLLFEKCILTKIGHEYIFPTYTVNYEFLDQ